MANMNTPWTEYMEPFKIADNLYFVGCYAASSHLITTSEGHILIDTGYPQNLYQVIDNIYKLGFNPHDIKYIVHSHGHYDHLGGTKALVELTGAKTFIGADDREYANGTLDLTWAKELGFEYYEAFEPDVLLHDGDVIRLGEVEITTLSTPGHTPGTMSFFFNTTYEGKTYRVGTHGGVGPNSMMTWFLNQYGLSFDCREKFLAGLERLKGEKVDIFIGNHVWNNDTKGRYERMMAGEKNPFIDPEEWGKFLDRCKNNLLTQLKKEEEESNK